MNTYNLIFPLNSNNEISAHFENTISSIDRCDEEPIFLLHKKDSIMLADEATYDNICDLRDILKKALKNELLLHQSMISDIGFSL